VWYTQKNTVYYYYSVKIIQCVCVCVFVCACVCVWFRFHFVFLSQDNGEIHKVVSWLEGGTYQHKVITVWNSFADNEQIHQMKLSVRN